MNRVAMLAVLTALILPAGLAVAQSPDDPAVIAAKEETVVVFDLVRFFGFLKTMEESSPALALSRDQLQDVYETMTTIKAMERVEPDQAEEMLIRLEDEVLTPDQLMAVDQLVIAREAERTTQTSAGGGDGGLITSYIDGGPFNPAASATRTIGKDFAAYLEIVKKKLGR